MKNKPILFIDFYKTINHDLYWRGLPKEQCEKIQELLFGNNPELANDWMRDKYTAEQVNKILAEKFDIPYKELWDIFVEGCKTMTVPNNFLNLIKQVRGKYLAVLITDNMDSFSRFIKPALRLENYFDFIINSFEQRALKADNAGALFLKYTKLYKADIKECICLDDSQNIYEIFTKLGGTAYLVTSEQDISYYLAKLT
jgi:FMN phosphatase YigB (HAD superfamily)